MIFVSDIIPILKKTVAIWLIKFSNSSHFLNHDPGLAFDFPGTNAGPGVLLVNSLLILSVLVSLGKSTFGYPHHLAQIWY